MLFNYIIGQALPFNLVNKDILTNMWNILSGLFNIENSNNVYTENILYASSKSWDNSLVDISQISSIGNIMYTNYAIWLIISSIILLLAMVGSIVITIKQK
jgi:NADH-ubiquinone oxidoreductase chain 6